MDKMPRLSNRLTALTLRSLPPGKHLDDAGLYLIKPDEKTGRWMLRYRQYGRRRDMGLGGWPRVGLGDARRAAEVAHLHLEGQPREFATRGPPCVPKLGAIVLISGHHPTTV